ncbi:HAMP domain-containing sensor histidine kinase [Oscillibacter sp.]|uniref:sensor histidine kinase n=1 Tax=Oscillibacter sp. TaxID=1945593 RepID=UPI0028A83DD8|nr:HAMP domain-containing sensor histidine kinase [Oscillibacter sp.]
MKFWQKSYLFIIVIFLIGFDATALFLITKSYSLSMEQAYSTADSERHVIQYSLQNRISAISKLYDEINENNLEMYMLPYGEYYADQKIYMELYYNDQKAYSNFPYTVEERPELNIKQGEKSTIRRELNGILYYSITGYLEAPYSNIKFVYIKDIQNLTAYKAEMIQHTVTVGIVVAVLLSVVLLFLLLKLTHPIRRLNQITKEIADGNYEKRADIRSKDEIGEFSKNFNTMADSVQAHIQELSDITQAKQRFINNLAHEMRTPITAIMGYGEFLKYAKYTQEEYEKAIDYIIHQSERMKNMAQKLMSLARLNHMELHPQTIDLREVLSYAERSLEQIINEKQVRIEKNLEVPYMESDKDLIESLILNLMENALRALPDGGKIEVKAHREASSFILSITDNGTGISQDAISKIFEPFYRADQSRSRAYGGAGLGLALCKEICDLHHAQMEIFSKPNIGTSITMKFTILRKICDSSEALDNDSNPADR